MGYPSRIYYSESDRQKIFDRWLAGESQNAIASIIWAESFVHSRCSWAYWWHSSSTS